MAKRLCTTSNAVVHQGERLSTQNDDVQQADGGQHILDKTAASSTTIEDLPNEILKMILNNVSQKELSSCRLVNWRLHKISNSLLATIPCDKPKNCYYSKKHKLLYIGELESEDEVAALRNKIKSLTTLKEVIISWKELWGRSTFNDSFLSGNPEIDDGLWRRDVKYLKLKAKKIGKVIPEKHVRIFEADELTVDVLTGLDAANIEQILRKFCGRRYGTVHIPWGQSLDPFVKALRKMSSIYQRFQDLGDSALLSPPQLGVVLKSSDDFRQVKALTKKKKRLGSCSTDIKLSHLEVNIKKKEHVSSFLKILETHANFLKSVKINVFTRTNINKKPMQLIWPAMKSLEKLEVTVVGSGEDEEGNILPPRIKFGYNNNWHQSGGTTGCIKKTFPCLKRLCIRPPEATDDEKWDAIYKAYYDDFLCLRLPDNNAPLVKWNPGLRSLKVGFPPKGNESKFGSDKYQRFCLELAKIFNVRKASDSNNNVKVQLSRFR